MGKCRGEGTRYQGREVAVSDVQVVGSVQYPPDHVLVYPGRCPALGDRGIAKEKSNQRNSKPGTGEASLSD
jgi:hypothetical protein